MTHVQACPRCGATLLWNGRGMACIGCSYFSLKAITMSEKGLPVPRRKKPAEAKK